MTLAKLRQITTVAIYGLGLEGQTAERFIKRHAPHATITLHDDGKTEFAPPKNWADFDLIIMSQGIRRNKIPDQHQEKITSITSLFFDNLPEERRQHVIGISGTKGKSTTTKFCHEVLIASGLKASIGGNYGVGILDLYDDFIAGTIDYIVAELSSHQLEYLTVSPGIAIFLNLFPEHLDSHGTVEAYLAAKSNLWRHQTSGDILIVPAKLHEFAKQHHLGDQGQQIIFAENLPSEYLPKDSVLRAPHFLENFGTVMALAQYLSIPGTLVHETAASFRGLPHRLELIGTVKGVDLYDDSISTNPDSTLAAVHFFDNRLGAIILGGQDREQNFTLLIDELKKLGTHVIIYQSETSERLRETLEHAHYANFSIIQDFEELPGVIAAYTPKGKVCVLSPAAPSYDRFKNFSERGDLFAHVLINQNTS